MNGLLSEFQKSQLSATLSAAAAHPFYAAHWAGSPQISSTAPEIALRHLPPVTKDHLDTEISPLLGHGDEIVGVSFSSGSTGRIVNRVLTLHESQQMQALIAAGPQTTRPRPGNRRKRVHLEFLSSWHGARVNQAIASDAVILPGNCADDARMKRTLELMRKPIRSPGVDPFVSSISGGIVGIYSFTRYLQDNGVAPQEFSVEAVGVFGGHLGPRRRKVIEEFWRCPVVDSFSISECRGKALVCPRCGYLSFDPQLVPLVLSMHDDRVIDGGYGRLALTELYPFGIAQPLVKYITGDLVEFIAAGMGACASHPHGVRRIGRLESSLFLRCRDRPTLLLSSQDIYDIFDRPGVFREDPELNIRTIEHNDLGQPWVSAKVADSDAAQVQLLFSYKPDDRGRQAAADLARSLRERLQQRAPSLASCLAVVVAPDPDTLCPMTKFA